jgi:hypothetical protein
MSVPGKAAGALAELVDRDGEDHVETKCRVWLRTASFVGLNQLPIFKFLREYDGVDTSAEDAQVRGLRVLDEEKAAKRYIEHFDANLTGLDEGSELWLERARAWIAEHHPPAGAIAATILHHHFRGAKTRYEMGQRMKQREFDAAHADEI